MKKQLCAALAALCMIFAIKTSELPSKAKEILKKYQEMAKKERESQSRTNEADDFFNFDSSSLVFDHNSLMESRNKLNELNGWSITSWKMYLFNNQSYWKIKKETEKNIQDMAIQRRIDLHCINEKEWENRENDWQQSKDQITKWRKTEESHRCAIDEVAKKLKEINDSNDLEIAKELYDKDLPALSTVIHGILIFEQDLLTSHRNKTEQDHLDSDKITTNTITEELKHFQKPKEKILFTAVTNSLLKKSEGCDILNSYQTNTWQE